MVSGSARQTDMRGLFATQSLTFTHFSGITELFFPLPAHWPTVKCVLKRVTIQRIVESGKLYGSHNFSRNICRMCAYDLVEK